MLGSGALGPHPIPLPEGEATKGDWQGWRLSHPLYFKRPGGDARVVVKVCARGMRGARLLFVESSPRLFGERAKVVEGV